MILRIFVQTLYYLKSFIAILLVCAFILQSAGKLLIIVNYQVNKESITKIFCENKTKPLLKCNGKCHLKKQLAKQDKKENTPSNNIKTKLEIQLFSENKSFAFVNSITKKNRHYSIYLFSDSDPHPSSVFHPPSV